MNLLTTSMVAERLHLSKVAIYKLIKSKRLKAYKLGDWEYRIYESDLDAFIKGGEIK